MNTDDIFCMIVQERMKKININSATLRYIEKVESGDCRVERQRNRFAIFTLNSPLFTLIEGDYT